MVMIFVVIGVSSFSKTTVPTGSRPSKRTHAAACLSPLEMSLGFMLFGLGEAKGMLTTNTKEWLTTSQVLIASGCYTTTITDSILTGLPSSRST